MPKIFVSSTCVDLRDLRDAITPTLHDLGYEVLASHLPTFRVDSRLHNHDNCLMNVADADIYLLIVGDRYGSTYDGKLFDQCPLPDQPSRTISVTWYEYLRAIASPDRQIRILIRSDVWERASALLAATQVLGHETAALSQALQLPSEQLDFFRFVLSRERQNWIHTFHDGPHAIEILRQQLGAMRAADQAAFAKEVAGLLRLDGYRVPEVTTSTSEFAATGGDKWAPIRVTVYICFRAHGDAVQPTDVTPLIERFAASKGEHAFIVTNGEYAATVQTPQNVTLMTRRDLLARLVDFTNYIHQVRHDYETYTPANPPRYLPVRTDLQRHFVPLECDGDYEGDLFAQIQTFLADPVENHLTILGDFGTGKSSSMVELTYRLLESRSPRLPLFVPLREHLYFESLQELIEKALRRCGVPSLDYASFLTLLDDGQLLLIFDGFDEMATLSERWRSVEQLRILNQAVGPNSKVILTCRTHYFTSQAAEKEQIENSLRAEVAGRRNFAIVYVRPLSAVKIAEFVRKYAPAAADDYLSAIHQLPGLDDLATRPVLLEMIIKTLPQWKQRSESVYLCTLYQDFTDLWLKDVAKGSAKITRDDKPTFTEALAGQLHASGRVRIRHGELTEYVGDFFKTRLQTALDHDLFEQEIRTCDFLTRDADGNYQFVHRSFMEFFVARKIFRRLCDNVVDPSFERDVSPEILNFLAQDTAGHPYAMANLCQWAFDRTGLVAWNAITALPFLKGLRPRDATANLVRLCRGHGLRPGVAWVLGELGEAGGGVVDILEQGLANSTKPAVWWESAFALWKLKVIADPVGRLVDGLPPEWTYSEAIAHIATLRDRTAHPDGTFDQRAVIAVVKEHCASAERAHAVVDDVLSSIDLSALHSDTGGRRSYYTVWLCGELRIAASVPALVRTGEHHEQASVRNMVAEALGKIGQVGRASGLRLPSEAVSVLARLLGDDYYRTRLHAARSIGWAGASELLPDLREARLKEWVADARHEMEQAISLLTGIDSAAVSLPSPQI